MFGANEGIDVDSRSYQTGSTVASVHEAACGVPATGVARGAKLVITTEQVAVQGENLVVIGRGMRRVSGYASRIGGTHINTTIPSAQWTLRKNFKWMLRQIAEGKTIVDIGRGVPPPRRGSPAYLLEVVISRTLCRPGWL